MSKRHCRLHSEKLEQAHFPLVCTTILLQRRYAEAAQARAMGVVHSSKGLMTAESSSSFRNKELDKGSIKDMIQYPLKGKVNSEYNQEKGQIPAGKGTLRNNSPFSIKDLQRGEIKSKEL